MGSEAGEQVEISKTELVYNNHLVDSVVGLIATLICDRLVDVGIARKCIQSVYDLVRGLEAARKCPAGIVMIFLMFSHISPYVSRLYVRKEET